MAILPSSRRSLVFLAVLVAAAGIRLAGESGIRLGSIQPAGLEFRWIFLLGLAAFFLVPASPQRPSIVRHLFAAIALLFLAALLTVWHQSIFDTPPSLVAQVSRPSDPARPVGETLGIDSLRLGHRRFLHQIVGRRRDIALDIQGYVLVQRTGQHRFFLSCDDACTLNVDDWTFTQSSREQSGTTFLESGLHPFKLHYVQKGGPAHLEVAWDRPAWIELLGLDHYVSSRPEDLQIIASNRREWQAGLCLASWLFWWTLAFGWVLRTGESRRAWKEILTSPPAASWVPQAAATALILFGLLLRLDALLVRSNLVEESPSLGSFHEWIQPVLPSYSLFNPQNAPDDPYRADVRSYLDRAQSMSLFGFYDASFREPFYVSLVSSFLWLFGGREIGILIQSFFFSVAVLPLFYLLTARLATNWWALAALVPVTLHEWLILEAPTGYRMSTYVFFLLVFVGWIFLGETKRWWVDAAVTGILGATLCLIRLSGLSLVVPLLLLKAWDLRKEKGSKYALTSFFVVLALIGPFLLNCYLDHGDPFYAVSFHTQFWLNAEKTEQAPQQVSLSRYLLGLHSLRELTAGTLKGLTTLPLRTFWNGLFRFPWLNTMVLTTGVLGLILATMTRFRFLTLTYFAHLIPFAYIQNFPSGQMPRFVMPAYFFLVLAGIWILNWSTSKRLSVRGRSI